MITGGRNDLYLGVTEMCVSENNNNVAKQLQVSSLRREHNSGSIVMIIWLINNFLTAFDI